MNAPARDENLLWCYGALPTVSRTFALNIRILPEPLRRSVTVAYLLFRIADTIEDTPDLPEPLRDELFDKFLESLRDGSPGDLDAIFGHTMTPAEADLIRGRRHVAAVFGGLGDNARGVLVRWLTETVDGMRSMHGPASQGLPLPEDLDRYCWYVAGTVGRTLTDLFADYCPRVAASVDESLTRDSEAFGRALQLTNILQDVAADHTDDGRCYLPRVWLDEAGVPVPELLEPKHRRGALQVVRRVARKALADLRSALDYTLRMPADQVRLRVFCLWPMFAALRTLGLVVRGRNVLIAGKRPKITRRTLYRDMAASVLLARSDRALKAYFGAVVSTDYPESWTGE